MRCRLWFALSLVLLTLAAAAPAMAAPENPPLAPDFLQQLLADTPPCQAAEQSPARSLDQPSASELPLQDPKPLLRVIYPNCGVACSDTRCSGQATGSSCTLAGGAPGWCKAANQVCPNEPQRSPCTCTPF